MFMTIKQDVKKVAIKVCVVGTKVPKGKAKDKAKSKSKAQKQPITTIAAQSTSGIRKGKVVHFFYGKSSH